MPSDRYPIYDQPPVAIRPESQRSVTNPPPPSIHSSMGSRRRSWQDLMAESASTVSDGSILQSSHGFGAVGSDMGNRRQSWLNVVDSQENLHKGNVSTNPSGASSGMRVVTVADNGKLQKEKHSARGNTTFDSRASTPSEFILVPKSYSKDPLPKTGWEEDNFGPQKSSSKSSKVIRNFGSPTRNRRTGGPWSCPYSPKKTLCIILLIAVLIAIAAIVGIVIRIQTSYPRIYQYTWWPQSAGGTSVASKVTAMLRSSTDTLVQIDGNWPFTKIKTVIDFERRKVMFWDAELRNYCFMTNLNMTALPSQSDFEAGAKRAKKTSGSKVTWPEYWHWYPEIMTDTHKDYLLRTEFEECRNSKIILLLDHVFEDQRGFRCSKCSQICLPEFSVWSQRNQDKANFEISRQNCFYTYIPEWSKSENFDRNSDIEFQRYSQEYRDNVGQRPVQGFQTPNNANDGGQWIRINQPQAQKSSDPFDNSAFFNNNNNLNNNNNGQNNNYNNNGQRRQNGANGDGWINTNSEDKNYWIANA